MECPFVKLGHTAFAYHSPGHRHLPGGPDMANAIVMRLIECESSPVPAGAKIKVKFKGRAKWLISAQVPAYRRARNHRGES